MSIIVQLKGEEKMDSISRKMQRENPNQSVTNHSNRLQIIWLIMGNRGKSLRKNIQTHSRETAIICYCK